MRRRYVSTSSALWIFFEVRRLRPIARPGSIELRFVEFMDRHFARYVEPHGCFLGTSTIIGDGITFPHGLSGIFIAGAAVIGRNCTVFHHVTIGANWSMPFDEAPIVGNDVLIGAGAQIIGRCIIGDGAKIGAGVTLVNATIPAGHTVINKSAYDLTAQSFIYPQD